MRVVVVDTGHANLTSVCRALEEAGRGLRMKVERANTPEALLNADKLVVPGQGGFQHCLLGIRNGVGDALVERVRRGTPFLGICLGLQALFESSEEAPGVPGLGLLAGRNVRLQEAPDVKVPHMGWNHLDLVEPIHPALRSACRVSRWFYFVHSYHAVPVDPHTVIATVTHGPNRVTAAVAKENILATQFHPEKSQAAGLALLRHFVTEFGEGHGPASGLMGYVPGQT
jgi:imidazole glycerol-phosphate synthase subunit HisH